jgi:hypothetical protein
MQLSILHEATLEDIERKIPVFMQKYFSGEESEETLNLIRQLAELDPTNGKYTEWVIRQYKDETFIIPEDNEKISKSLAKFHKIKSRLDDKDINSYTPGSLAKALGQHGGESKRQERKLGREGKLVLPQGAELVLDNGRYKAVKVTDPKAASLLCSGTQWCTANPKPAETYLKSGFLYLIYVNNERKYLIHYETNQFMDIYNTRISDDDKLKLVEWLSPASGETVRNNSSLAVWYARDVIKGHWPEGESAIMKDPKEACKYASSIIKGRWPEAEPAIMKSNLAGWYAKNVIKGRWPEAEPAIMKSSFVVDYAQNIIQGRWPKAEPYIMKSHRLAYEYARDVIKGRWPEGESVIIKDPERASTYAQEIIKGRWPEAEPAIAKKPYLAYHYAQRAVQGRWPEAESYIMKGPLAEPYARYIIRGRWPEAESYIMKDPDKAYHYAQNIIKGRWPKAEPIIMKDPRSAGAYARQIIKGRWPEGEPAIMKDPSSAYFYARDAIKGRFPEGEPVIMKDPYYANSYTTDVIDTFK